MSEARASSNRRRPALALALSPDTLESRPEQDGTEDAPPGGARPALRAHGPEDDRVERLELELRERDEASAIRETELTAMERDLALKEAYIARLEAERRDLLVELGQVRARAAELFGDLERAESRIAQLDGVIAGITGQRSYQLSVSFVSALRRSVPLLGAIRRVLGPTNDR